MEKEKKTRRSESRTAERRERKKNIRGVECKPGKPFREGRTEGENQIKEWEEGARGDNWTAGRKG